MKTMRIILSVLAVISCTACRNTSESKQNSEKPKTVALKTTTNHKNLKFDHNVLSEIKKHYQDEFGIEESGKNAKSETEVTDSTYNITYRHFPDEEESFDYHLASIYIPTNEKGALFYGDLNNDNLQDLVVAVSLDGPGSGYDNSFADIFVFLNQNEKLILSDVTNYREISNCEDGYFWPVKIDKGYLVGNSYCYGSEDARCCPSVKYVTKLKLLKNKLVYQSQHKIK